MIYLSRYRNLAFALLLAAVLATIASTAHSAELIIETAQPLSCDALTLSLTQQIGDDSAPRVEELSEILVPAPGKPLKVPLAAGAEIISVATISDCAWTPQHPNSDDAAARVRLWPGGSVRFTVDSWALQTATDDKNSPLITPRVSFETLETKTKKRVRGAKGEATCEPLAAPKLGSRVAAKEWLCHLAAGRLDLKIELEGAAPVYLWAVDVGTGDAAQGQPIQLGKIVAKAGGSVQGWVTSEIGPPAKVDIKLENALVSSWSSDPTGGRRMRFRSLEGTSDSRGFFQITGVDAGTYRLSAKKEGLAPIVLAPLAVDTGRELVLPDPLHLTAPIQLVIQVDPPHDPAGQPWQLAMRKHSEISATLTTVDSGVAQADGVWRPLNLIAGEYALEISDQYGNTWSDRDLTVHPGESFEYVELPMVAIAGRLTLGDEPLAAAVLFGTTQHRPQIRLETDEEGLFEGYLPRPGIWPVDVLLDEQARHAQRLEDVDVTERSDGRPTWIGLELPDTHVYGQVQNADGKPATNALVLAVAMGDDQNRATRELELQADEQGRFEAYGLTEGTLRLFAKLGSQESEWRQIHIQEKTDPSEIILRLKDRVRMTGQILRGDSSLAGVALLALPRPLEPQGLPRATSGADGAFELDVPADSQAMDLILTAPGLPTMLRRIPGSPDPQRPLLLDYPAASGEVWIVTGGETDSISLTSEGATAELRVLLQFLAQFGKVQGAPEGLSLSGFTPGHYRACNSIGLCDEGVLTHGGGLRLAPREQGDTP